MNLFLSVMFKPFSLFFVCYVSYPEVKNDVIEGVGLTIEGLERRT